MRKVGNVLLATIKLRKNVEKKHQREGLENGVGAMESP